ncbi:MAG TPA: sulfotransferase family 2 domain-containing protein [Cyanophyceae cyanobacterium]
MNIQTSSMASHLKQKIVHHLSVTRPQKILFDHLPKCGGSTLNSYLEAHYLRRHIFSTDGLNPTESVKIFKSFTEQKRHGYSLVKGHLSHDLIDFADPTCLKVTVLRDPVKRIISHYFYARENPDHYLYANIHNSEMGLEEYVSSNLSDELRNWYTTHFSGLPLDVVEKYPEESMAQAAEVLLKRYDIIGFLDNFALFIENLRKRANLRYEYNDDNRVNVTKNKPCIEDIPKSAIAKIESMNHLDIALYQKIKSAIG